MNLNEEIKKAEEQAQKEGIAQTGNDWFKFTEGDNMIRVLVKPEIFFEKFKVGICYTDCGYQGTARFMAWILDRKDNKIKLARLPYVIGATIAQYQMDPDYAFDVFPMPYDIKIYAKDAGTKEVTYTITPRPKRESVENTVIQELQKQNQVPDILQAMKDKQKQKHVEDGTWQKEQDRKAALKAELEAARGKSDGVDEEYPEYEEPLL